MRIVFQCYALFGALVMVILTSTVAFNLEESTQEFVAKHTINLCYLVAGPLLLVFVQYGFVHFKNLAFLCSPRGITHQINFIDIVILLSCFVFSLCVVFTMAMQRTLDMAQSSF